MAYFAHIRSNSCYQGNCKTHIPITVACMMQSPTAAQVRLESVTLADTPQSRSATACSASFCAATNMHWKPPPTLILSFKRVSHTIHPTARNHQALCTETAMRHGSKHMQGLPPPPPGEGAAVTTSLQIQPTSSHHPKSLRRPADAAIQHLTPAHRMWQLLRLRQRPSGAALVCTAAAAVASNAAAAAASNAQCGVSGLLPMPLLLV